MVVKIIVYFVTVGLLNFVSHIVVQVSLRYELPV